MIVIWVLVTVLLVALVWLISAPIRLCINTYKSQYYLQFGNLIRASYCWRQGRPCAIIKIPFYTFHTKVFRTGTPVKSRKSKVKPAAKKRKSAMKFSMKSMLSIVRTFSVKRCHLDVDTDNYVLNAQLIPVFQALSHGQALFRVNFHGKANLWLVIENRLIRLIGPILKYAIKQKM